MSGVDQLQGMSLSFRMVPCSAPLATLLKAERMSRPQVVKHIWDYIKANNLQNPEDRREIIFDDNLKAVFNVDRLGMFKMNKELGR